MKKQPHLLQYFILPAILIFSFVSCNQIWNQSKYGYLKKVAATARCESDTVQAHMITWLAARDSVRGAIIGHVSDSGFVNKTDLSTTQTGNSSIFKFTTNEVRRIFRSHPEISKMNYKRGSLASAHEESGLFMQLLVFFVALFLFLILLAWSMNKQYTCLASAIGALAVVVLFVLALQIGK